jgi:hypothetical protein
VNARTFFHVGLVIVGTVYLLCGFAFAGSTVEAVRSAVVADFSVKSTLYVVGGYSLAIAGIVLTIAGPRAGTGSP